MSSVRLLATSLFMALSCSALSCSGARADDVTVEIERARKLYLDGKIADAKQSLDKASQLISQHRAKLLGEVLPQPMTGWTTQGPDSSTEGSNLFGGGIAASRTYQRANETCVVSVVGDSPAMAMINMVLSNPNMASAAGAKVQRIAGQRGLITSDGQVQILTDTNTYLITVSGSCREGDKLAYGSSVDYPKLAGF